MKFQFDPNQEYQLSAISSVVNLFEGQKVTHKTFGMDQSKIGDLQVFSSSAGYEIGYSNGLSLNEGELNKNLKSIQRENQIISSEDIKSKGKNFSIEMETGTGKTYVYLRTIFELNKQYGFCKFIIVVPSVAIREGVLKSIEIMRPHFNDLYNKVPFEHFIWKSKATSQLRSFSKNNGLQMMIINIDAFNKESNIMNSERDQMGGIKPIEFVRATNPIVIMDEPQNMESEASRKAIESLNPLCTLRYSATHRNLYNPVYRLDPVQAFQKKLVKKISVVSLVEENDPTRAYIKILKVINKNNKITCTIEFFQNTREGRKKVKKVCKQHDDLFLLSKENSVYKNGFKIVEINCKPGLEFVKFASGLKLHLGEEQGGFKEEIIKIQIRKTIKAHFEKELQLRDQGIKVLSLFFLDYVGNYRVYKDGGSVLGPYGKWFEEIYKEISEKYKKNMDIIPASEVHSGYFSKDRKGILKDTKGNTKDDTDTYSLIMKDKEKLLDIKNPLKFIFSHSALREGWDNPNIFQICTLNETGSPIKKRQEIGRGLRLPVNQEGKRVQDELINNLVVVVNESYGDFVKNLQKEIEKDCGFVFGTLPLDAFVDIVFEKDGKEHKINQEKSKEIWRHLKKLDCLSEDGFIEEQFNDLVENNKVSVPDEFKNAFNEVIKRVEQYQLESHVRKHVSKKKAGLNKKTLLDPEFEKFWKTISQKTFYSVYYESTELVKKASQAVCNMEPIKPLQVIIDEVDVNLESTGVEAQRTKTPDHQSISKERTKVPDILAYIQERVSITKRTIFEILKKSKRLDDFVVNPQKFMDLVIKEIQTVLQKLIIEGIQYERLDEQSYEMSQFYEDEHKMEFFDNKIVPTKKSVYDYIYYESGPEKRFAQALENMENIKYFVKLPSWFKIPTPVGNYNPDWAILKKNGNIVYMIRETKSNLNELGLRGLEKNKIKCGQKHFESIDVNYKACTSIEDANL